MGIILKDATTLGYLETKRNRGFPDFGRFRGTCTKTMCLCVYVVFFLPHRHI